MSMQRSLAEMLLDPRMGSNRKLEAIGEVIDGQALQPIACRIRQGIARRRAPVERVFASMKQRCKFARMRCYTFARNLGDVVTFAIVHNLKRASTLAAA